MQATVELTEQEIKALESHVRKAVMMARTGFMSPTTCDKILGKIYLALAVQRTPEKEGQECEIED